MLVGSRPTWPGTRNEEGPSSCQSQALPAVTRARSPCSRPGSLHIQRPAAAGRTRVWTLPSGLGGVLHHDGGKRKGQPDHTDDHLSLFGSGPRSTGLPFIETCHFAPPILQPCPSGRHAEQPLLFSQLRGGSCGANVTLLYPYVKYLTYTRPRGGLPSHVHPSALTYHQYTVCRCFCKQLHEYHKQLAD